MKDSIAKNYAYFYFENMLLNEKNLIEFVETTKQSLEYYFSQVVELMDFHVYCEIVSEIDVFGSLSSMTTESKQKFKERYRIYDFMDFKKFATKMFDYPQYFPNANTKIPFFLSLSFL